MSEAVTRSPLDAAAPEKSEPKLLDTRRIRGLRRALRAAAQAADRDRLLDLLDQAALVFSTPARQARLLELLAEQGVAGEAKRSLGVDWTVGSREAEFVVFDAGAFEDFERVFARLDRRGLLVGKRVLVIGHCPDAVCLAPENLDREHLAAALALCAPRP